MSIIKYFVAVFPLIAHGTRFYHDWRERGLLAKLSSGENINTIIGSPRDYYFDEHGQVVSTPTETTGKKFLRFLGPQKWFYVFKSF